jgi:UDP-N-acetylglucosamine acyltransferase
MNYPHTYIHPKAKIAEGVKIDPFTVIHENVEIGEGTWIGSNVTIMSGARIGKNCRIFPGAVISAIPQDLKFGGEDTTAEIGDNTTIREFVTVHRGTSNHWKTIVGSNCLIMAYSHVAHDCVVGDNCILSNNSQLGGHVSVGDWAIIAGMAAVQQFSRIGAHAYIGGGCLVNKDIPPFIKVVRMPIIYGGVNSVGLKRRGFTLDQINEITSIYRIIYGNGLNITQALEQIEKTFSADKDRNDIVNFIRGSKIGIVKGYKESEAVEE